MGRFLFDMSARWRDHEGNDAQLTPWGCFGESALTCSTKSPPRVLTSGYLGVVAATQKLDRFQPSHSVTELLL